MFKVSTDFVEGLKESTTLLPPWKQKPMDRDMFDRDKRLFKGGAHMPLAGYMGAEPRRSSASLARRDVKEKAKWKAKQEALANQKACGKGNGKTDGKTRKYERREPVRVNGDTPWLWDNASVRTSSAPVGKGVWNGYQPTMSTGRDQAWGSIGWSSGEWTSNQGWYNR